MWSEQESSHYRSLFSHLNIPAQRRKSGGGSLSDPFLMSPSLGPGVEGHKREDKMPRRAVCKVFNCAISPLSSLDKSSLRLQKITLLGRPMITFRSCFLCPSPEYLVIALRQWRYGNCAHPCSELPKMGVSSTPSFQPKVVKTRN